MHGLRVAALGEPKQCRRHKRGLLRINAIELWRLGSAADECCFDRELSQSIERRRLLRAADQRPHAGILLAWIADLRRDQLCRERVRYRARLLGWDENTPDGGAFLPGLDRHLAHDLPHERIEGGATVGGVGRQYGRLDAVG